MPRKPDETGKRIATLAARILGAEHFSGGMTYYSGKEWHVLRVEDLLGMAASLTNQAPGKSGPGLPRGTTGRKRRARRK